MKIIGPRAFVTRFEAPRAQSSLIEVIEFDPELSQYAMVVAVGNGVILRDGSRRSMDVNPGDTVLLGKYSGAPFTVTINGNEVEGFIVSEEDMIAVVEV